MKKILIAIIALLAVAPTHAQTRADIFGKMPVTWLGLDFTQLKYVGTAAQFKEAGSITSSSLRNKYFDSWNELFIKEEKKYNVADAIERDQVAYATEVTEAANNKSTAEYFTQNPADYQLLTSDKIAKLVAAYDFKGKTGLGMLFFVEGMSKDKEEASMWVTFVNMGSKTVLLTRRETGSVGGFGFRNYWAKSFYDVLTSISLKKWK